MVALNEQAQEQRRVLHLLHYIPERRGEEFDTIEDVIPLYNLAVSVRADKDVESVKLVPQNQILDFSVNLGRVEFMVPQVNGYQIVEIM
jgi:hypothetical protein